MSNEQFKKLFLVVVIIGFLISVFTFSFSFFYMQAKGSKGVSSESATLGLSLNVKRLTSDDTIGLMPLEDDELISAVKGSSNGSCVDSINNGRCQVYEVKVTNTGNVTSKVMGTLDLQPGDKSKFTNLKWAEITSPTDATIFGNIHLYSEKSWKNNYVMGAGSSSTFYLLIWISETGENQNLIDKGSFSGSISFNSAAGAGTTAAFSG